MKYTIALLCTSLLLCSIAASADTINVSGKSSVVFVLQHAYHSSGEPQHTMTLKINGTRFSGLNANSGTVFNVKARPGANFRIRIENFNKLKYTVKETPTATPEPKLQLPSIFTKAFDGLIPNPPTPAGQSLGTSTVDFDKIMNKFYQAAQMTANFMRTVQKAKSDAETEEDQDKFLDDLSDAGAMYLGKDNPDWYKPDNLGKLIDNYSKGIEIMKDQLYMAHQQALNPTVTQQYAIKTAQSILTEATTFQGQLDQVKQTLNAYATDYKNQIFTYISPKPTSFSSGKLNLKVEIFAQSETKQENAIYRLDFDIDSSSNTYFDVSTGVFFSNVRDESYNLKDKTTGLINPSASANNIIVRNGTQSDFSANFGALIHYGWMVSNDFGIGPSLGLATANSQYQFFVGLSLALGRDRHFYISGGWSLSNVKRLKGYNVGDTFTGAASDIPTDSYLKSGTFFGISYKF